MKTRILTALITLPVLIASIVLPSYVPNIPALIYIFVGIAVLALGAGLFEFYSLTKTLELKADAAIGYFGAAILTVAFIFDAPSKAPDLLLLSLALFIILTLTSQTFRFQADFSKMLTGVGVTLLGVFYVVFLGGFLISIRVGFDVNLSTKLLGFFFLIIMGADTGAYFAGKSLGKHKLAPKISPGKTVEGLIGGIAASLLFPALPLKFALPLAGVMAIVSVLGDLAESAMKRGSDAKDAANILPGHGGLLDRLDSLLFNAPILYYFAKFYFNL
jgi:phosphatidate cytidylyltransferase